MTKLDELHPNAAVGSILTDTAVRALTAHSFRSEPRELSDKAPASKAAYQRCGLGETCPSIVEAGQPWSSGADGAFQRLHLFTR